MLLGGILPAPESSQVEFVSSGAPSLACAFHNPSSTQPYLSSPLRQGELLLSLPEHRVHSSSQTLVGDVFLASSRV